MEEKLEYGIQITSPELSTQDKHQEALTFDIIVKAFDIMLKWGLHNPKSIADAAVKLAEEHLDVKIEALSEDELQPVPIEESESKPESLPEPEKDVIQSKLNWELPSNQKK
jgi:hypothetical protein